MNLLRVLQKRLVKKHLINNFSIYGRSAIYLFCIFNIIVIYIILYLYRKITKFSKCFSFLVVIKNFCGYNEME